MTRNPNGLIVWQVCKQPKRHGEGMHGEMIRESVKERIREENPEWKEDGFICFPDLKAELEIRNLHEKVDHLLVHQWQRMMEIREVQMDLLAEVRQKT